MLARSLLLILLRLTAFPSFLLTEIPTLQRSVLFPA